MWTSENLGNPANPTKNEPKVAKSFRLNRQTFSLSAFANVSPISPLLAASWVVRLAFSFSSRSTFRRDSSRCLAWSSIVDVDWFWKFQTSKNSILTRFHTHAVMKNRRRQKSKMQFKTQNIAQDEKHHHLLIQNLKKITNFDSNSAAFDFHCLASSADLEASFFSCSCSDVTFVNFSDVSACALLSSSACSWRDFYKNVFRNSSLKKPGFT